MDADSFQWLAKGALRKSRLAIHERHGHFLMTGQALIIRRRSKGRDEKTASSPALGSGAATEWMLTFAESTMKLMSPTKVRVVPPTSAGVLPKTGTPGTVAAVMGPGVRKVWL